MAIVSKSIASCDRRTKINIAACVKTIANFTACGGFSAGYSSDSIDFGDHFNIRLLGRILGRPVNNNSFKLLAFPEMTSPHARLNATSTA